MSLSCEVHVKETAYNAKSINELVPKNVQTTSVTEDKEFLEDLIAAAVNDAVRKVESQTKSAMNSMTGGIDLPAGFKMPF